MGYLVYIEKQAKKTLRYMSKPDESRVTEKIVLLGENPNNPTLDIKKLQGEPYFRLRVGDWRIIFNKKDTIKVILIDKIKSRGDVYK